MKFWNLHLYKKFNNAVLWVSAALLLYVIIGGLGTSLKTGIVSVEPFRIKSDSNVNVKIKLHSPAYSNGMFKLKSLVLKNANDDKRIWEFRNLKFNNSQNTIESQFVLKSGKESSSFGTDMFLKLENNNGDSFYVYYPDALWVEKSSTDTGLANSLSLNQLTTWIENDKTPIVDQVEKGFPSRNVLYESIRNLLYHVPMWFSMLFLLGLSMVFAMKYLSSQNLIHDYYSEAFTKVAILNGILGCITGSIWARVTWQSWWPAEDPKLNGVAIGMLMYLAYLILRGSIKDTYQKARISSVYSVLIYPVFIALIAIMPKLSQTSLHPGTGGSVGFNKYDLDNTLRFYFYPAVLGWIGLFYYVATLKIRLSVLEKKQEEMESSDLD
jgi:heme exporter protein C